VGQDLDPFGRRKDENPLAALGWDAGETASTAVPEPQPEPPPTPERPAARARPTAPADAERLEALLRSQLARGAGFGLGRLVRAVVVLAVLFAVVAAVMGSFIRPGVQRADDFARDLNPPGAPDAQRPGAGESSPSGRTQATLPARGLSVTSLLRPAAFGKAMRRLRTGGYGRLTNLRVAPDRIDASMLTKDGRIRQVQIVPGGAARVLATTPTGFAGAKTMSIAGIDRGAPSRLTRSAAGRLKQAAGRVDYLVYADFAGTRQWNVYFKGGQIFSADAHGQITRRIS
jgi:hypothetical protein